MTVKRDGAYIWVTWITSLMAADRHCGWSAWFRAHHQGYEKVPSDFDLAAWKAAHGEMVRARADELRAQGYAVFVEDQNKFSLKGRTATLGGVADLVAVRDGEGLVVDCKSGQRRDSDAFQVLTYMLVLPLTHAACKGVSLAGEVQYRDGRLAIPAEKLDAETKALITATIERVGGDEPLPRVPSVAECRFCDIGAADCPERVDEAQRVEVVRTDLF